MREQFFRVRFQVFLWVVTVVSILLNVYLITSKVSSYTEVGDILADYDDEQQQPKVVVAAAPQDVLAKQWVVGSGGVIAIDVNHSEKLDRLLASANINAEHLAKVLDSIARVMTINTVAPGTRIQIHVGGDARNDAFIDPKSVTIFLESQKLEVVYNKMLNSFEAKKSKLPLEWQARVVSGTINGSLFSSLKRAGAEPAIISQLINLFSYDIDFQRDIHAGDTFRVMYEYQTDYRGKVAKNPKIMYANINLGKEHKELFRHAGVGSSAEYYDRKGNSIKKALLKTPINGAKITSSFGPRMHPILGYSRMHEGLDYGAPKGTPVFAAGDGVVVAAKTLSRGYGKHVQIKHNGSYDTLYGHLSRFASNVAPGARVKQGQVIGYVGSTGLASGPHLHYEVIHQGKRVNPAKVKGPTFIPLKGKELVKFKDNMRKLEQMVAELDDKRVSSVALNR